MVVSRPTSPPAAIPVRGNFQQACLEREFPLTNSHRVHSWSGYTPEQHAARAEQTRRLAYQRAIAAAIRKIGGYKGYLTDQQREELRELADAG